MTPTPNDGIESSNQTSLRAVLMLLHNLPNGLIVLLLSLSTRLDEGDHPACFAPMGIGLDMKSKEVKPRLVPFYRMGNTGFAWV